MCRYENTDRRRTGEWKAIIDCLERRNERLESIVRQRVPKAHSDQDSSSNTRRRTIGPDGRACLVCEPTPKSTSNLSIGSTNHAAEDFDRGMPSRTTGFIGKNTDAGAIQALHQATMQTNAQAVGSSGLRRPNIDGKSPLPGVNDILRSATIASMSYSLDDMTITSPATIDPREKPPFLLAEFLVHQYFPTIQRYFPIIDEASFMHKFLSTYNATDDPAPMGTKWSIMMNLVFAVSAKYSETLQAHSSIQPGKHLEYFTRARMCGLSESSLFDHADIEHAQVEGLTAFYFLVSGQIHRYGISFHFCTR